MKKIEIKLQERQAWIEETHLVKLQGYSEGSKEAEKSIKDMLGWNEDKAMEIKFYWISDDRVLVDFRYETRETR
jgi:hypothetical protein